MSEKDKQNEQAEKGILADRDERAAVFTERIKDFKEWEPRMLHIRQGLTEKLGINTDSPAVQKLSEMISAVRKFDDELEARGYPRGTFYKWALSHQERIDEAVGIASKSSWELSGREFTELADAIALGFCIEDIEQEDKQSKGEEDQANSFPLIGRPTTAKCVRVGFNDNRFQELCWYLTPQDGKQTIEIGATERATGERLPGGKIFVENLMGEYELSKFDRLVLAALWTVSREPKNKAAFPGCDPVPVATIPLVVLQLSGNKTAAYNPEHSIYKFVKESIERLHGKVWDIDLRQIIKARGLHTRWDIGTIARPLATRTFEGEPVTIMTPQGDEHEAWTVRSCWIEEAKEKIFNNSFDFSYYREFFPKDVRTRPRLDLFVELLQISTNRSEFVQTVYLRKGDAPRPDAYALFPSLGWVDVTEQKNATDADRKKDTRARALVEKQIEDLVATGCFEYTPLRRPALKKGATGMLYGFRLKFIRGAEPIEHKSAARQLGGAANRAKRKTPPKGKKAGGSPENFR